MSILWPFLEKIKVFCLISPCAHVPMCSCPHVLMSPCGMWIFMPYPITGSSRIKYLLPIPSVLVEEQIKMSSCPHVPMSSCPHVLMSPCPHVLMSPIPFCDLFTIRSLQLQAAQNIPSALLKRLLGRNILICSKKGRRLLRQNILICFKNWEKRPKAARHTWTSI